MVTEVSQGVKISVETFFQNEHSDPDANYFFFSYTITIENLNEFPVKLLSRRWNIYDSLNDHREVQGQGVVGRQPELAPGESHQYTSGCDLNSDFGAMRGTYTFKRLDTDEYFHVAVPEFKMMTPTRMN